uniref:NYN domain-containing protein n=1 Tax=Chromera velia CCMP2878 TaxID=1169474 RepID=A0A0G4GS58_9ALVE|eukprot:Cvel_23136.t1-p1 / transcript=Cvel_23136.t1 / gene=Cvel_23136 / organism=Chromera_velia_CCMP2878 / gene_product=hypothetical protein / transcript_product=hypothetical protein / location=Cvel_scaffold2351:19934-21052(+) / protein_length=373 / sequence_SO=supercontig / SO=protein_coding / is_pseudo=false
MSFERVRVFQDWDNCGDSKDVDRGKLYDGLLDRSLEVAKSDKRHKDVRGSVIWTAIYEAQKTNPWTPTHESMKVKGVHFVCTGAKSHGRLVGSTSCVDPMFMSCVDVFIHQHDYFTPLAVKKTIVVLISGDKDFSALIHNLSANGYYVVVIANRSATPAYYSEADAWSTEYEEIRALCKHDSTRRASSSLVPTPKSPDPSARAAASAATVPTPKSPDPSAGAAASAATAGSLKRNADGVNSGSGIVIYRVDAAAASRHCGSASTGILPKSTKIDQGDTATLQIRFFAARHGSSTLTELKYKQCGECFLKHGKDCSLTVVNSSNNIFDQTRLQQIKCTSCPFDGVLVPREGRFIGSSFFEPGDRHTTAHIYDPQ